MSYKDNLVTDDKSLLFNDLMVAKNKDLMYMVYQPQYDFKTKEIIGVEALLRYESEKFGKISPDKIIDIFNNKGLLLAIDLYVVEKVFKDILKMNQKYKETLGFRVAINLSGSSLKNSEFIDKVCKLMWKNKINGSLIEFELTETEYLTIEDIMKISENVERLKMMDINISIDDFGIGFSNFSLLKYTNIDTIKIDKCFIDDDEKSRKILECMFILSDVLGLSTVVEGVENIEQEKFLEKFSCDVVQGYYYSKPISLTDLNNLVGFKVS